LVLVLACSAAWGLLSHPRGRAADEPAKGVTAADVVVDHTRNIEQNASVGPDASYRFRRGGVLVLNEDVTLEFAGTIDAGPHRIFQLAKGARVDFSRSRMTEILPEWFGAGIPGTPAPAQASGFQQAVDAAAGKTLRIGHGDYYIRDVVVRKECNIVGVQVKSTRLHLVDGAKSGITFDVPSLAHVRLTDFFLDMNREAEVGLDFPRGLTGGVVAHLVLSGKGRGIGLAIHGEGPDGKMNNNTYQTRVEACNFYNFDRGIFLDGKNAPGGRMNLNIIAYNAFSQNRVNIELANGSSNVIEGNNMNPVVRDGVARVVVVGAHGSNLFLSNYWDEMGKQVAVHCSGFEDAGQYSALSVVNDNLSVDKFRIEPAPTARRDRAGQAPLIQLFGMYGAARAPR
jgi:hypothetical protein